MSSAEEIIEEPKTNATGKGLTPPAARNNSEPVKLVLPKQKKITSNENSRAQRENATDDMSKRAFRGLYLQPTGAPTVFSFVTYTPQSRQQMIACGDLKENEEYINPVICDFLLFISEWILKVPFNSEFPINYDDVKVICSRKRGNGIQHEYLVQIQGLSNQGSKRSALNELLAVVENKSWNGFQTI